MTPDQQALWHRVQAHALDDPCAAQPFSLRLAKENRWTPGFTQRAMVEYLRFAFIATASGHPVAPSDAVDQVWHLHLLHTRDYWGDFCPRVLGAPLHHGPARGGREEQVRFGDWYGRTLASYRQFFGEPPADIWPPSSAHPRTTRIAIDRHWIVAKPRIWIALQAGGRRWLRRGSALVAALRPRPPLPSPLATTVKPGSKPERSGRSALAAVLLLVLALLPAAQAAQAGGPAGTWPFNLNGPEFLLFFLCFTAAMFAVAAWLRSQVSGGVGLAEFASDLSPYELGELADGHGRAFLAAVVHLHLHGQVVVGNNAIARGSLSLPAGRPLLERAIVDTCSPDGTPIAKVREAAQDAIDSLAASLTERGLQVQKESFSHLFALGVALLVPVSGFVKIQIGLTRHKPVEFLFILTITTAVGAFIAFGPRPRLSRQGRALLGRVRAEKSNLEVWRPSAPADLALAVSLFGLNVLARTELEKVGRDLKNVPTGSNSTTSSCGGSACSSGGGDGGGGDGGGGGGCGGCGGD